MTIKPKPQVAVGTIAAGIVFRDSTGVLYMKTSTVGSNRVALVAGLLGNFADDVLVVIDDGFYTQGNS